MAAGANGGEVSRPSGAAQGGVGVLRAQLRADCSPVYTVRVGIALMVFYVFALQCVSTVAVVRRETNSWKWPIFQRVYMGALAWSMAVVDHHGARSLGFPYSFLESVYKPRPPGVYPF